MAHRRFTDSSAREWNVWNVSPSSAGSDSRINLGHELARGWLCFETDTEKRRLASFPSDWNQMDDGELEKLCANATPVKRARRSFP
jgi:hypothetical protein